MAALADAQLAARLTARLAEAGLPCARRRSRRTRTPRRLAVCQPELDRSPGGSRRDPDGTAGVGGVRRRRASDERRAGVRAQARRGLRRNRARRKRRRAPICRTSATFAARRRSMCCRSVLGRVLRDLQFPKAMNWDAQLEDDEGRLHVRAADSLVALSLRRPRRALHDRAAARWRRARACRT